MRRSSELIQAAAATLPIIGDVIDMPAIYAYAFHDYRFYSGGAVLSIDPSAAGTVTQVNGILITGSQFIIQTPGIYVGVSGGRLETYNITQANFYINRNNNREITSINSFCATLPLQLVANDVVDFQVFFDGNVRLRASIGLYKIN